MSKITILQNMELPYSKNILKYFTPTILLGLILLLGIVLRLHDLGTESYMSDEMFTVIEAQQSVHELVTSGRLDQPPAYYLPLLLWVRIFGTNEVSTRSFSALTGIGSIFVVYWIGQELFGKRVGLLSAFLMAISGLQIYYSQTARYYSFFMFTTLLSYLFFILLLSFPSKRIIYFALYVITSILMVYSHAFGIFILAAQNLFFFLQGKNVRKEIITWIFCQALILLAIVPYFYPITFGGDMVEAALSNTDIALAPPLWEPLISLYKFIIPFRFDRSWGIMIANYFAAFAFLVTGTWIYANRQGMRNWIAAARGLAGSPQDVQNVTRKLFLVSCWLIVPILLPFILSWLVAPIYNYKYMIGAAPALYLLMSLAMLSIRKMVPLIVSLGALLVMVAPGLHYYYVIDVKDQWKEVAIYVEENARPNDVIVFPNDGGNGNGDIGIKRESFYWYYQGTLQSCRLNIRPIDPVAILEPLMKCLSGHDRFWLIYLTFYPEVNDRIQSFFLNSNQTTLHFVKEQNFVNITIYLFELSK